MATDTLTTTVEAIQLPQQAQQFTALGNLKTQARKHGITFDFDPDALMKKYHEEREKRAHNGGVNQYLRAKDVKVFDYEDDPYAKGDGGRAPVTATYDVVILGAGYTSLQAAARLIQKGFTNICLIEKGADVGGTWYWNRYPGVQCDVESYIYMPLLELVGSKPSQKYVAGHELLQHARGMADKFHVREHTLFQTIVKRVTWANDCWKVETSRDDNIRARWVVTAAGAFHSPKFPGVRGIEDFKGKSFHTSRWDYEYTGGTPEKPEMAKLGDKRVAIIGTGATAVQVIPQVAKWAKELYVIQRTPSSIDFRGQKPTNQTWFNFLPKGWQEERQANFNNITSGVPVPEDMINDGWTTTLRTMPGFFGGKDQEDSPEVLALKLQMGDFKKMETLRRRVDATVKDRATAEALKPWYNLYCKRPCFHDEYLKCFNEPNVHLVDTKGEGVEKVTEVGIVASGQEIEVDCIIYATGFEWGGRWSEKYAETEIVGRDGESLATKFEPNGPAIVHGWAVHGFPNLCILSWTQSGTSPNATYTQVHLTQHLVYLLEESKKRAIRSLEPTKAAEEAWLKEVIETGKGRNEFLKSCVSGYYNNEGDTSDKATRSLHYAGGLLKYNEMLRQWREDGKLEGFSVVYDN